MPFVSATGKPPAGAFWALPGEHVALPLDRITDYPVLAECLAVWRRLGVDGLPSTIDPLAFPRAAIRGLNLFEHDPQTDDWRIRLVGSLVTDHVGTELRGTGLIEAFSESDRHMVRTAIRDAVGRGEPDLVRRRFVDPRGMRWSYVRLFLPLGGDGRRADRFATVIDPDSFGRCAGTDAAASPDRQGQGPAGP